MQRRRRRTNSSPELLEQRALLATITVTSLADNMAVDGEVTLREALQAANDDVSVDGSTAGDGDDRIEFDAGLTGVISLASDLGSLNATEGVVVVGNGRDATSVNAGGEMDAFQVGASDIVVSLQRLTFTNATAAVRNEYVGSAVRLSGATVSESRYGIYVRRGKAVITGTTISGNTHGIFATIAEKVTVKNSDVTGNKIHSDTTLKNGAGIYSSRTQMNIVDSRITENAIEGNGRGAGVFLDGNRDDEPRIKNSTISGNSIASAGTVSGAGLFVQGSSVEITQSEIFENTLEGSVVRGAGIGSGRSAGVPSTIRLIESEVHSNSGTGPTGEGGGIYSSVLPVSLSRSTVRDNTLTVTTSGRGAAVYGNDNGVWVANSTLSNNDVVGVGETGETIAVDSGFLRIRNSTVVGVDSSVATAGDTGVEIRSSVIYSAGGIDLDLDRSDNPDIEIFHNLIGSNELSGLESSSVDTPDENGNIIGTPSGPIDPMLQPLTNNGGRTLTHRPLDDSPVINRGSNENSSGQTYYLSEQRGEFFPRETGGVDIGAIEAGDAFFHVTTTTPVLDEADAGTAMFEVRLSSGEAALPITVSYSVYDETTTAEQDYEPQSGQFTFSSADDVLPISVPILNDDLPEHEETLGVLLTHESLSVGVGGESVKLSADEDFGVNVSFRGSFYQANELLIRLDEADDTVDVSKSGEDFIVVANGQQHSFAVADVDRFNILLGDGDNTFRATGDMPPTFVRSGNGSDSIATGDSSDTIFTSNGHDTVHAGGGDYDRIFSDAGRDSLDGGPGKDLISAGRGRDTIVGGNGDDFLYGHEGRDRIFGGAGNDKLVGGPGGDSLEGGNGNDEIQLGDTKDQTAGIAKGGKGNDTITIRANGIVNGGSGNDTINQLDYSVAPTIRGASGNDKITAYQGNISGDEGADTITLSHHDELSEVTVNGGPGRDLLTSNSKNSNTLIGGTGNDTLQSNDGSDRLEGGDGNDRLFGKDGSDTLLGGTGKDRLSGQNGADVLSGGQDDDVLLGGNGDDSLRGNDGNDILLGQAGADQLRGFDGIDILIGGTGTDTITGHEGEDILVGGSTTHSRTKLGKILNEWTSERDQATRAANIRDGSGGGDRANSDLYLDATTVSDDEVGDELLGSEDNDWFFARTASDTLNDKDDNELFDEI